MKSLMKNLVAIFLATPFLFGCASNAVTDQSARHVTHENSRDIYSERRDTASAAIGTVNYLIGRMGVECSEPLGKDAEYPKQLVNLWQANNAEYLQASTRYLASRMKHIEASQGKAALAQVQQELAVSVRSQGARAVEGWLTNGDRSSVCKKFISNVESGRFDVNPGFPEYETLKELLGEYNQ